MKSGFFVVFVCFLFSCESSAQTIQRRLRVWSITEYVDGYVIKAIDPLKSDTINIVSMKDSVCSSNKKLEKIKIDGTYNFMLEDRLANLVPGSYRVNLRIKQTILWNDTEPYEKRPFYASNMCDLFIERKK